MNQINSWAIIEYQKGWHLRLPNTLARHFVPCIIPMTTEFNQKAKKDVVRPALRNWAFIPGDERHVQIAIDRGQCVTKVWRMDFGTLNVIPDASLQRFLDGLDRREKKPPALKRTMKLGDMAESDAFEIYAHLFGIREAIKKFGKDLS